jgi:hypothetical protein
MRNEKTVAANDGIKNLNEHYDFIPRSEKTQLVFNFGTPPKITTTYGRKSPRHPFPLRQIVCDVCCAPLYLYSATFISAYLDPRAELPPTLCDNHLSEMEQEVAST